MFSTDIVYTDATMYRSSPLLTTIYSLHPGTAIQIYNYLLIHNTSSHIHSLSLSLAMKVFWVQQMRTDLRDKVDTVD